MLACHYYVNYKVFYPGNILTCPATITAVTKITYFGIAEGSWIVHYKYDIGEKEYTDSQKLSAFDPSELTEQKLREYAPNTVRTVQYYSSEPGRVAISIRPPKTDLTVVALWMMGIADMLPKIWACITRFWVVIMLPAAAGYTWREAKDEKLWVRLDGQPESKATLALSVLTSSIVTFGGILLISTDWQPFLIIIPALVRFNIAFYDSFARSVPIWELYTDFQAGTLTLTSPHPDQFDPWNIGVPLPPVQRTIPIADCAEIRLAAGSETILSSYIDFIRMSLRLKSGEEIVLVNHAVDYSSINGWERSQLLAQFLRTKLGLPRTFVVDDSGILPYAQQRSAYGGAPTTTEPTPEGIGHHPFSLPAPIFPTLRAVPPGVH